MSDEEIMKALECCASTSNVCDECPIAEELKEACKCGEYLFGEILDLIYRQRAEIERLEKESDKNFEKWNMLAEKTKEHYSTLYEEAKEILKAEAVREFAENVKAIFPPREDKRCSLDDIYILDYIDNLVKEMVGDEK